MPNAPRLFAVTGWLLKTASILCLGLVALLAMALGVVLLGAFGVIHIPIPPIAGVSMGVVLQAGAFVILACIICVALWALVLMLITRIVDSAATGDPFVTQNAWRLNQVGWVLLVLQGVGLLTGMVISAMPQKLSADLNFGFDVSLSGLFAALLVFVLAQIFQRGSEMRAELEGTI